MESVLKYDGRIVRVMKRYRRLLKYFIALIVILLLFRNILVGRLVQNYPIKFGLRYLDEERGNAKGYQGYDNALRQRDVAAEDASAWSNLMFKQRHRRKLLEDVDKRGLIQIIDLLVESEEFLRLNDHWLRTVVSPPKSPLLNCQDVAAMENVTYLSRGWTKMVHSARYKGLPVAIKSVDASGRDVTSCLAAGGLVTSCYHRAARKLVKEIILLSALRHENVITLLGFCISARTCNGHEVTSVDMVTELGTPVDQILLLQMSWENRLKVLLDISRLVHHVTSSQLGPVALNDLRPSQLVLVGGTLKLTDLDDAGLREPACGDHNSCHVTFSNVSERFPCNQGQCHGHNECLNVRKTGNLFLSLLLPHGVPATLTPYVAEVMKLTAAPSCSSLQLLTAVRNVVDLYKSGAYLQRKADTVPTSDFAVLRRTDLPGLHDYRCRGSLTADGCTHSAFDLREARHLCHSDPHCRGFVWTASRTWTGRTIIHLKNGTDQTSSNFKVDLYLKKQQQREATGKNINSLERV